MATKKASGIKPYIPPVIERLEERGGGPITPASSLLHRMGKREVDEEVIEVVAWATSYFSPIPTTDSFWDPRGKEKLSRPKIAERLAQELLDDLGLEWIQTPMGGLVLRPKAEHRG